MFALYDTFNDRIISRHRSIETAVKAEKKFQRLFSARETPNTHLPTQCRQIVNGDCEKLNDDDFQSYYDLLNRPV